MKTYPRTNDFQTIYLNTVITNPNILVGDYTIYNDFVNDPTQFEKNNVLYHYPINRDRLIIGKFCSIACGAKFLFDGANHTLDSLSNYTFPLFFEEWGLDKKDVASAWDNKGDIVVGNDVWIGYEAVIMAGVHIGDGAVMSARAVDQRRSPSLYHRRRNTGPGKYANVSTKKQSPGCWNYNGGTGPPKRYAVLYLISWGRTAARCQTYRFYNRCYSSSFA